jgi:hypothetical protein
MDPSSAPLADYFWIAGIDSLSYSDLPPPSTSNAKDKSPNGAPTPPIEPTIEEGAEGEYAEPTFGSAPRARARHSRNNSWQRLSRISKDDRNSIQSIEQLETANSNRSSVTIRPGQTTQSNGVANGTSNGAGLSDFDFDKALSKFASERESFLDDLSFTAGTILQSRPPMTSRAEKVKHDESEVNDKRTPFQRVGGSIRRKISFRDLNSMKRQTTVSRTSKWKSQYKFLHSERFMYSQGFVLEYFFYLIMPLGALSRSGEHLSVKLSLGPFKIGCNLRLRHSVMCPSLLFLVFHVIAA